MIVSEQTSIPDDFKHRIEAVKAKVDCREIFKRFWPNCYREHGNVRCPWHEDKKPSAQLDKELFYCHACGLNHDAIALYQQGVNVELPEAVELLENELGASSLPTTTTRKRNIPNPKHKPSNEWIKTWNKLCKNTFSSEAAAYIEETRQIKGLLPDLIQKELIAYHPKFKAYNHETETSDIWRTIAFPLVNAGKTEMLGIQYIWIDGKGKKFATGTNGKECFFFYGHGNEFCVITEAVIDGLSVYSACHKTMDLEVVSIMSGGKGYEEKLSSLTGRLNPVLFFDNDDAGRKITALTVQQFGGKCRLVDWTLAPEGMKDCNDLLKAGHCDIIEKMVRLSRVPTEEEINYGKSEFDLLIEELNERHAVVMVGGRCVVINETIDPAFGGTIVTYSSPDDFRNYYRNRKIWMPCGEGKSKQIDAGKVWLEAEGRRQFKGIVFNPGITSSNGYYNLFRGFAFEPVKGDWSLFRDHIYHVIASGNRERFAYLIAWMAHTVQQCSDTRPGVTIVLRGGQGAGKGCFATVFGRLFGHHFQHIWQTRQLTGNFNQHLKDAILVFVDEGFWAGDKQSEGVLKAMISEERIAVEPKGKDVFFVRNYMRLIIASNNQWVVPAAFGERRFFVLDVSALHQQDRAYFESIFKQMQAGGYAAMMYDLLEVDISNFDLSNFPRTEALFDQIYHTMPTVQKFWFEKLRGYAINQNEESGSGKWPSYFVTSDLYGEYVEFCQATGDRHPIADRAFTKELKRMCPGIARNRHSPNNVRVWCLDLPEFHQARDLFQAFVGRAPVDWDDEAGLEFMARDGPAYNEINGLSHVAH